MDAYQRDDDEGGSRDGSTYVGPDTAAVQNAHPPGQLALEQGADLGVEHDLEVTLHHILLFSILVYQPPMGSPNLSVNLCNMAFVTMVVLEQLSRSFGICSVLTHVHAVGLRSHSAAVSDMAY